jgi:hypothetical protein
MEQIMATNPKTPTNKQHAAFPSLFKRTGEARRVKGYRASRETFHQAMRLAKALDNAPRLCVMTPSSAMVLSEQATELLKEDGGVASLILNGFQILPYNTGFHGLDVAHDNFLSERGILKLEQGELFNGDDE